MENKSAAWQERFGLAVCPASDLASAIPAAALGVAVIYARAEAGDRVFLVIESRAGSLRDRCLRRLATSKLPPAGSLFVAFKGEEPGEASAEAVHEACRRQVVFAGELRRELRPAMR